MYRPLPPLLAMLILACVLPADAFSDNYFTKQDAPRPNIVLIMSDDMGISDIGCYGSEVKTPVLDRLAEGGVRFKQFYNTGRCCPTRASLLTGLYSHQAGIGHMLSDKGYDGYRGELAKNGVTIAEALRPAGYSTYMIGKWHVTTNIRDTSYRHNWPLQRGFDKFYGMVIGAASFFDPASLTRGNKNITPQNDPKYKPKTFYFTDAITDNTVTYLKEHQREEKKTGKEKPFFAYVAYTAAHWPMHALPEDIAKYKGCYDEGWDALRAARHKKMIEIGLIDKKWGITPRDEKVSAWDSLSDAKKKALPTRMEAYAAMIDRMDQGIGTIVAELKRQGKLDNTLILFLQDNGGCAEPFGLGEKTVPPLDTKKRVPPAPRDHLQFNLAPNWTRDGRPIHRGAYVVSGPATTYIACGRGWANAQNTPFRLYKHWEHEGGIASPLIVSWDSFFKKHNAKIGGWVQGPGHLIDLMATCLDVAGATYPKKREDVNVIPCEGESLVKMFLGKKLKRDTLYWEHEGNCAVLKGDWKLVSDGAVKGPWELYNLAEDRCEMNDLAAKMPKKVAELKKLWQAWAKRAQVLPLNPPQLDPSELWADWGEGQIFPMDPRPGAPVIIPKNMPVIKKKKPENNEPSSAGTWRLEPVCSIKGFKTPECAEVNPADGTVYVSNIFAVTRDKVKALDSNGFISTLAVGGKMKKLQAIQGTTAVPVHAAFGMCFFDGHLYFNDVNNLKRCPLGNPSAVEVVPVPGTDHGFNDATCDDRHVYVTGHDAVFRVDRKGKGGKFVDLKGVNGVKCWKGKLFAVTTAGDRSDLYELDPTGKNPPKAFGLAPKFAGIDGIEVLDDGTFLITDCHGHKVYTIAPDRKTVTLVAEGLEYPADLGVDHKRGLVYIPQFFRSTVEVYRLKQGN